MTEPIQAEAINSLPGVLDSFQADRNFEKLYESSQDAGNLCDISSVCLKFAANLADQVGLGSLERMTATGTENRFMLFSKDAKNANPPGPRIFGITTELSAKIDEISEKVTKLL